MYLWIDNRNGWVWSSNRHSSACWWLLACWSVVNSTHAQFRLLRLGIEVHRPTAHLHRRTWIGNHLWRWRRRNVLSQMWCWQTVWSTGNKWRRWVSIGWRWRRWDIVWPGRWRHHLWWWTYIAGSMNKRRRTCSLLWPMWRLVICFWWQCCNKTKHTVIFRLSIHLNKRHLILVCRTMYIKNSRKLIFLCKLFMCQ